MRKKTLIILLGNDPVSEHLQTVPTWVREGHEKDISLDVDFMYGTTANVLCDNNTIKEELVQYDEVIFQHKIGHSYEKCAQLLKELRETTDTKTVLLLNEYWHLPKTHPQYKFFVETDMLNKKVSILHAVNSIVTYSAPLKESLSRLFLVTSDVRLVDPNFIRPTEECPTNGNVRIGLIPNPAQDIHNMELLRGYGNFKNFKKRDDFQMVLCGFNMDEVDVYVDVHSGERIEKIAKPEDTLWVKWEKIVSNDYYGCSPLYKEFLSTYLPNDKYTGNIDYEPYRRVWKKEVDKTFDYYSYFDVFLSPKEDNDYNRISYDFVAVECNKPVVSSAFIQNAKEGSQWVSKPSETKQWTTALIRSIDFLHQEPHHES